MELSSTRKKVIGSLLLIIVAAIWGTAFVFQRTGMDHIEPVTFNASRMTLAAIAVGVLALSAGKRKPAAATATTGELADHSRTRDTIIGGICCGGFLGFASIFQQMGIVYTTAGKAGFITALYILLVPVLNFVIFRKRSRWFVWVAVLIGVAGMYLLCMAESIRLARGDTLICICAVLFSGHILSCDYFAKKGNPIRISAIQFVTAAVISWIAAFIMESPGPEKIWSAAVPILYCGIVSGGIGYTLQIVAQRYTEPAVASLLMSLESVFAVIAGTLFLGERMSTRELLGCIVMFIAMIIVQVPIPKKKT